MFFKTATK